ncbi:MAG: glycosyltransferase, partial [Actinomycetia bacterium]|nr:glycosyltransferase [Actinomycetes bacterium]
SSYFYASDLFALPSTANSEAFGYVQLEAHACGLPVVSTNLPTGVPYANLDNVTGLIVPPSDSEALAAAINKLLQDDALRQKLGSQAKKRVENQFNFEVMAEAIEKVYQEALTT